jgi:predicted DNA-binding protein
MSQALDLKSVRINILLTESLEQELAEAASRRGMSKAAYVRYALEKSFNEEDQEKLQQAV